MTDVSPSVTDVRGEEQERTEETITVADDEAGGDVVLTRIAPQVVVEKAPSTSRISLEVVQHSDPSLLWISGNRLFVGNDRQGREVIYRVVGWDENSWSLLIVRDSPATPSSWRPLMNEERTEEESFGFQIEYREPYYDEEEPGWAVFLPHQCDSWTIAGGDWSGIPLAAAVAELERFIAEAQATLEKLRSATPPPGGEGK